MESLQTSIYPLWKSQLRLMEKLKSEKQVFIFQKEKEIEGFLKQLTTVN